ncbi:MAG: hypothetical protein K2X27_13860 [Candidatus Obscuribacterales bacterium]|nr:hypothetical protein [Candidatus Obscuribacterales bacterium]
MNSLKPSYIQQFRQQLLLEASGSDQEIKAAHAEVGIQLKSLFKNRLDLLAIFI